MQIKALKEKVDKISEENTTLKRSDFEKTKALSDKDREIDRLKYVIEENEMNYNLIITKIKVNNI